MNFFTRMISRATEVVRRYPGEVLGTAYGIYRAIQGQGILSSWVLVPYWTILGQRVYRVINRGPTFRNPMELVRENADLIHQVHGGLIFALNALVEAPREQLQDERFLLQQGDILFNAPRAHNRHRLVVPINAIEQATRQINAPAA